MIFTSNLAALKKLLKRIRKFASTKRQKGKIFENLALSFFRNEPYYKEEFPRARRYADWAESQGLSGHEKGIDIASSIAGKFGSFCAIRCIFCSENSEIKKNKIENFLALSKKKEFIQGFIVTPGVLEPAAMAALAELAIPVTIIGTTALGNSLLDWSQYKLETGTTVLKGKKVFRPYQEKALTNITQGLKKFDRGILVMATGSGKTLISLRLAENILGLGRKVLYLVPSLTKLSQVLTEWTQESNIPIQSFPVGPDVVVDTINSEQDDDFIIKLQDLQYPAISAAKILATTFNQRHNVAHLSVIFATYSSLDMLRRAQVAGLPELDLIICDDAHRTAGSKTIEDRDEPSFVQVHDNTYINAKKRLYMTATPKIFTVTEKPSITDSTDTVVLYSMEEPETFGPIFHNFSYSEAINEKVLVDYKILIVTIDERYINQNVKLIEDPDNSLMVTDAAKIVGSFRALARHGLREDITGAKIELAQRAVVFCQIIEPFTGKKVKGKTYNKVSSKLVAKMFSEVVENYLRKSDEPSWLRELKT
ncbi:MAG: DEAD/DEAH box helicase family protein, partial [Deltaproteobacteria bacterium]|nr:DEAD/DEAH box helicase family protein [Deltaproteobacteria bacterium]